MTLTLEIGAETEAAHLPKMQISTLGHWPQGTKAKRTHRGDEVKARQGAMSLRGSTRRTLTNLVETN